MPDSSPHSIRDALISHSWEWKDDEGGATATSVHASECRRCAADAALDGLIEQLETARSLMPTLISYALSAPTTQAAEMNRDKVCRQVWELLDPPGEFPFLGSNPAKERQ